MPGRYYLSLWVKTVGPTYYDILEHCLQFEVEPSDYYGTGKGMQRYYGIIFLPRQWRLHESTCETLRLEATTATA